MSVRKARKPAPQKPPSKAVGEQLTLEFGDNRLLAALSGPHAKNFARINVDIGSLPGESAHGRLMNQDSRVRKAVPLSLGTAGEEDRRHGRSLPQAIRNDIRFHEIHSV